MALLNQKKGFAIITMLISPIIGLIYGLFNLDFKGKRLILTLFGIFYGILLNYSDANDAGAYARLVKSYYTLDLSNFINRFYGIITFAPLPDSPNDLYIHFLCGIAGSLFGSVGLLFAIVGGVYGYLYGNAMLKIIKLPQSKKIGVLAVFLVTLFVIHRSFENMQTIRSWTGMWVLFNGVLGYYQSKKRKYLFLMIISPFFHLMYAFIAIPAILLAIFKFIPRKLIIGIYLFSFVANVNTLLLVNVASENQLTEKKLGSYYRINDDGEAIDPIANRQENSNAVWYAKYGKTDAVYYGATYFICFFLLAGYFKKEILTNVEYGLFATGILMASLANFLSFAYALYSRTMANATVYILAVLVLLVLRGFFINYHTIFWRKIGIRIGVLIFIPKIVFFISYFIGKTSMLLLALPFLIVFGESLNFSIKEFIKVFI